jgi:hypothetical protein
MPSESDDARALTKWLLQQGCQERTATIKEMAREIDEAISEECRARQKADKLLLLRVDEDLEARRHRNGAARPGLQHEARDADPGQ